MVKMKDMSEGADNHRLDEGSGTSFQIGKGGTLSQIFRQKLSGSSYRVDSLAFETSQKGEPQTCANGKNNKLKMARAYLLSC